MDVEENGRRARGFDACRPVGRFVEVVRCEGLLEPARFRNTL